MAPDLCYNKLELQFTMSLVSALNESDDLETLENSSEDSATDLETDFEKHDDGIGFSAPAGLLKTTTRRELRTKSDLCVTLHASWFIHECQRIAFRKPT